jgi:hypothetical protein
LGTHGKGLLIQGATKGMGRSVEKSCPDPAARQAPPRDDSSGCAMIAQHR